jgi:hypothetical protein
MSKLKDSIKNVAGKVKEKVGDIGFTVEGENFAIEVGNTAKAEAKAEAKARRLSQKERRQLEEEVKESLAREYAAAGLAKDQAASQRVRQAPAGQAFRALRTAPKSGGMDGLLLPAALLGAALIFSRS